MSNIHETSREEWTVKHYKTVSKSPPGQSQQSSQSNQPCKTPDITVKIERYITKANTFKQADQLLRDLQELKEITKVLQGQPLQWITK